MQERKKERTATILSTHPSSKNRIASLNGWINEIIIKYPPIKS